MNKENINAEKKKRKRRRKKKPMSRGLTVILTVFLMVFIVGVLSATLIAVDVLTDIRILAVGASSPKNDIAGVDYIDLDTYLKNQSKTTIIYAGGDPEDKDAEIVEIARLHGEENREWVDIEDVDEDLINAVVALEDKRFYEHKGVDWIRTVGVVVKYSFSQGGSTITQQLIKNLTGENAGTFVRKYKEIKNALALELHFDKDEILEAYLNTIYLDMGCYGIKTGAEYYFDKEVDDLTLMESAILASITNAPRRFNPIVNYDNNRDRATQCLYYMLEEGYITQEQLDAALEEEVEFYGDTIRRDDNDEEDEEEIAVIETEYNSYYVDYIIECLIDDFQTTHGLSYEEALRQVYYGGLKVYAAVDLDIQDELEYCYENRIPLPAEKDTPENPALQSSMVILDYEGRLVATVGRFGEKTGNRTLNIGTSSPRQPGSCIKPLTAYAPGIESGYFYWSSLIPNYGISIYGEDKPWPTNYGGVAGDPNELYNLPQAIAPSYNTIPARIISSISTTYSYEFLKYKFHISTLEESDNDYAPLSIGAMAYGLTCLEMSAAYVTFGNGGIYYEPWCYYKVTDASGEEVLLEPDREGERVISEATADIMLQLLRCVVTYPSGTGGAYAVTGQNCWAKTGTTSNNRDRWIVGGTPYYVGCVWTGYESVMKPIDLNYYGGNPAGRVYKEVMSRIHDDLERVDFELTGEAVQRTYCTATGLLAKSGCPTGVGWYDPEKLPSVCSGNHGGLTPGEGEEPGYDIPQF